MAPPAGFSRRRPQRHPRLRHWRLATGKSRLRPGGGATILRKETGQEPPAVGAEPVRYVNCYIGAGRTGRSIFAVASHMNEKLWKQHFPEFAGSNDDTVKQLMAAAVLIHLPAHQQVFYPGKICENYLLLLSGSVKAQIMSPDGREILLYHVRSGDSCVLTTSCLLGDNDYPAEAFTETEITAFAIPATVFQRCLTHSQFFREFVFRHFSKRLTDVIRRMENISFGTADQKLAKALLAIGETTVYKTHHELALESGTAREVVSRHLKRFENYGWLTLGRGCIQNIDYAALQRIAGEP